jgi:hypothetical protein
MSWRLRLAAVVAVALIAATVVGVLMATGAGDGGGDRRPTGERTVLRLEAVDAEVPCGPGGATVFIYLDDLEDRPSPLDADQSFGLAAFELPLTYDPAVLQIGEPINIELNSQLSREDSDGDGVPRTWIPTSYINDTEGWAMLAAVSFNPNAGAGEEESNEEGLVAAAKGAPILLLTVRFQTVGEGTSRVAIEPGLGGPFARGEVSLHDPGLAKYEEVTAEAATITVSGGDCSGIATSTPLPTRAPPATLAPEPTRPIPSPMPLTPTPAADGGRPDCPQNWAVYRDRDRDFSLCYPPAWSATTSPPDADLGTVITLSGAGGASLTVYWRPSSYFDSPDFQDRCRVAPAWEEADQIEVTIAGVTVPACTGYETLRAPDAPPLRSTFAEIPVGEARGFLTVFFTYPEGVGFESEREASLSLLGSLRLE